MDDRLGARDEKLLARLREEVVGLAVEHHLVSAYTSLVAVDVTPERDPDAALASHRLGAALPSSWQADADFGFGQGATSGELQIAIGLLLLSACWAWRRCTL